MNNKPFYQIPKELLLNKKYRPLSAEAVLLYGMIMDRMKISEMNHLIDEDGKVFAYFSLSDASQELRYCSDSVSKYFKELEDVNLIERIQQGRGKPAKVYLTADKDTENFCMKDEKTVKVTEDFGIEKDKAIKDTENLDMKYPKISDTAESRPGKIPFLESEKIGTNKNIYNNYNNINNIYYSSSSIIDTERGIKEQIDYDLLIKNYPYRKDMIKTIIDVMVEIMLTTDNEIKIRGISISKKVVKHRFYELGYEHIEFVIDRILETKTQIRNIRSYLLTALYNAPMDMDAYYTAKVEHDLHS